ncbi:hypothetical protein AB0F72_28870 [Actinoplanes sp. NPDC023936]|uniref:hypothetical protein n=1 Tax=Actinoplanes sp. NPDC023936 TaxID=3154910 RepID=UPI0033D9CC47
MERRNDPDDDQNLRIARYVLGHAEASIGAEAEARTAGISWPNISDYWPDAPARRTAAPAAGKVEARKVEARKVEARKVAERQAADRQAAARAKPPLPPVPASPPPPPGSPRPGRPVALAGFLALLIAAGTILLVRPRTHQEQRQVPAAVAPPAVLPADSEAPPESPEPKPSPSEAKKPPAEPSPPATSPAGKQPAETPPPRTETARFELTTGVTELSVRVADLDGGAFRVSTPDDSGLDAGTSFADGVLRVSTKNTGNGSGRLNVQLSDDIVWHLRMSAGVHVATFDSSAGTVSRVDLDGGAQQIDVALGRLVRTVPIRMTGGVHTWRITTAAKVPVRVRVGSGAGDVAVYGRHSGGAGAGTTVRSGDLHDRAGLEIDAQAGMHSLDISQD